MKNEKASEMELKQRELDLKEREIALKEREASENDAAITTSPSSGNTKYYAKGEGVYPEASERYLVSEEIKYLNAHELKIMRNEIFARHGYIFKTEDMILYFNKQSWYKPLYSDVTASLTPIEKRNVEFIQKIEK